MKKFILLTVLLFAFDSYAQYGYDSYGNSNRQRQNSMMQTQQKAPEPNFDVERFVGVVIYDIPKAAKKSKIKLTTEEGKSFSKILTEYNNDIKDITRINSFLLRSTKDMVEGFQKSSIKSGDFSDQQKVMEKMNENLKPISETLIKEDQELDKKMKLLLSEKQYTKWIKYNEKLFKFFKEEEE